MSISGTMSSALSGWTATSRAAELISSNIANALTEGYARRELEIGARQVGDVSQGVQINGVTRQVNQVLLNDRRLAAAASADCDVATGFLQRLESAVGSAENAGSLVGRIAALDGALISAASQPQSEARLVGLADAARNLTETFQRSSEEIQSARSTADTRIAADVKAINRALSAVAELNGQIVAFNSEGRDPSALEDQRQQLIDRIAPIVPLREMPRENGRIALYTITGAALLDGRPAILGFSAAGVITPDMTLASGALSGLTLNGKPVKTDAAGALGGGSLSAQFAIRDTLAPDAQANLDAVARDLIERFADPALDSTLVTGDAGLFTDRGLALSVENEVGLAGRITLNSLVTTENGGAVWKLRDGLGATTPGPVGDARLLGAMERALTDPRPMSSGPFSPANRSFSEVGAQLTARIATDRLDAETEASFTSARYGALQYQELGAGVDTDRELQDLLLIERAYAANAKVVQTVDDMMKILLGM